MGKVIGICNQKGGTGKTTTAINLSANLSLAQKRVLLIDIDPQGNATSGIGINSDQKNTLYELLIHNQDITNCIYPTEWRNFFIIPSQISLTGGEIDLVSFPEREYVLKKKISKIQDKFDWIILDAPPSLSLLTVNTLVAANSVIIPIQCEYYALEGVSKLLHTIDLVKERLNPDLTIEGVLLTMADFRTRLTLQVIEEVRKYFQHQTFNTIIPRNIKLAEAPSFGKPIYYYEPSSVGAKAYLNLAEELLQEKITIEKEKLTNKAVSNEQNSIYLKLDI